MYHRWKKLYLIRSRCVAFLIPAILFFVVFTSIVNTIPDYGLTWDEPIYIENAKTLEIWFTYAVSDTSFFSKESIEDYWTSGRPDEGLSGNVHPPFCKLSAIAFRHLLGTALFNNIVYQYRVSTAFWTSILVLMLFIVIRKFTLSNVWAFLGGLSFFVVPRFFAHAHFFATDMIITSLGFSGLVVFTFAAKSWTRILLGGVLFGAALATKFTGILAIAIVAPLIFISDDWKRFIREYCLMIITACVCFSLFNPPMLFNPYHELEFYFSSVLNREKLLPITSLYFGKFYSFHLPIHQPWVMLGITLPSIMVITAILGFFSGIAQFVKTRNKSGFFTIAPFLILMSVYMLPSTPKHDGIRLFSSVWPFIVLMSILGCYWLQGLIKSPLPMGMSICIISLLFAFCDIVTYHPYELSHYNIFIGGAKGAQDKGLMVTYWYDAFNKDFLQQMNKLIGTQKVEVYSWPNQEIITFNQLYGLYPAGLRSVSEQQEHEYTVVLNRFSYKETYERIKGSKPLIEISTRDGAYIGGLYQTQK